MDLDIPPQPRPDLDTAGFWEATANGRLALCRCTECGLWLHPPLRECRRCGGKTRFEPISGRGAIYTFTVVRHPAVPGFLHQIPYVVAIVELDEQAGLRLPTRLVGAEPETVRVGQRVVAEIVDLAGGDFRVPVFRRAEAGDGASPSARS